MMWQLNRRNSVSNEVADESNFLQDHRLDLIARTLSQNLEFAPLQQHHVNVAAGGRLEKSHSLPVVNRQANFGLNNNNNHRAAAADSSAMKNETFGNFAPRQYQGASGSSTSNPFLDNSVLSMMSVSAVAGIFAATASSHRSASVATSAASLAASRGSDCSDEDLPGRLLPHSNNNNNNSLGGGGRARAASPYLGSQQTNINTVAPMNGSKNSCQIGPSKLYILIASPPQDAPLDWDVILHRALSHPHEACFFDPNAGGHVFALHKLLRRTGHDPNCRPPFPVVEAVMKACPRAVTRKQAMVDADDVMDEGNNNSVSDNFNAVVVDGHVPPPQLQQPPLHEQPNNGPMDEDEASDAASQPPDDDDGDGDDHDDVRFEYPLAIACEWEQDGEVVRLLASSLKKTNPVYRSEVFRSLDYASLPNHFVRILLEENPNCVLERGTSSEENEGDDDDSPLEKVLFWWDDPDMLGMEDDIASYPNCNMRDDLCDLFEKLRMMLYAAAKGSMNGYDDNKIQFQVLHHVLRIVSTGGIRDVSFPNDFTHAVLLIAKFIQRERAAMFQERDETGSLPIHIACSEQGLVRPSGVSESNNSGNDDTEATNNDTDAEEGHDAREDNDNLRNDQQAPHQLEEEENDEEGDENDSDEGGERISVPSGMEVIGLLLENNPNSIRLRDSLTGCLPLHLALQCNPQVFEVIEKFIDIFPLSVSMPDGSGRLPLHIALLQKSPSWEKILCLYPAALECRDPVTGLLPFQLAAMSTSNNIGTEHDNEENEDSLSLCFQLLRKNPCLATGLGKMKPRPQSLIEQQIMTRYKPRVLKLEEENERLQQRVKELESQLKSMTTTPSECQTFKKRKSTATLC